MELDVIVQPEPHVAYLVGPKHNQWRLCPPCFEANRDLVDSERTTRCSAEYARLLLDPTCRMCGASLHAAA